MKYIKSLNLSECKIVAASKNWKKLNPSILIVDLFKCEGTDPEITLHFPSTCKYLSNYSEVVDLFDFSFSKSNICKIEWR